MRRSVSFTDLYREVYAHGQLYGTDQPFVANPLLSADMRKNSIAVEGLAFGDEGKGRIIDEICTLFNRTYKRMVVYRWNGGANAGHTVVIDDIKIALHQLPAGVLTPGATVILGKGMVLHPGDLITEIEQVARYADDILTRLLIDEMAVLALDTHRAFESSLKTWESGGKGSTERGISPAYADLLYRHPVRVRDLCASDWEQRLGKHYELYAALLRGLGHDLAASNVRTLANNNAELPVGTKAEFLKRLADQRHKLLPYIKNVFELVRDAWHDLDIPFVFEGAQAIGLDVRYGVYPDITASDPTFGGILASTEGLVDPADIAVRVGALKATYSSSVGVRRLPTMMGDTLAHRIREDAHEYGATTRRPRDIAYIDLPCLKFFADVSGITHLVLTHLDIAYIDVPIKVCTHYTDPAGNTVPYRPDQEYLDTVQPHYIELPTWHGAKIAAALDKLPEAAKQYIAFISGALSAPPIMATTGPERDSLISWLPSDK